MLTQAKVSHLTQDSRPFLGVGQWSVSGLLLSLGKDFLDMTNKPLHDLVSHRGKTMSPFYPKAEYK